MELLRPPDGYRLDYAIGTTYSLDLLTLLTIPLAFSRFDWAANDDQIVKQPAALLASLRKYSQRLLVFCQAGRIYLPTTRQLLFGYLEDTVVQVRAPLGGVFHPKVWILRFESQSEEVAYRLVCLTRNLTFDRSWDTSLVLEGPLVDRKNAYAVNRPLADFVLALPGLANDDLDQSKKKAIKKISDELLKVSFDPPLEFDDYQFLPLGIPGYKKWPFEDQADRSLIVSPFLNDAFLKELGSPGRRSVLISRLESLNETDPRHLKKFKDVYVLNDAAESEKLESDPRAETAPLPLEGLHSKLFIIERGRTPRVLTGSANATDAGFEKNVEFLVELKGRKSKVGIDSLLSKEKGKTNFVDLLSKYNSPSKRPVVDKEQRRLESLLDQHTKALALKKLTGTVSGNASDSDWQIHVKTDQRGGIKFPKEIVSVTCWPIAISENMSVAIAQGKNILATFPHVSFEGLTIFFAFRLRAKSITRSSEKTCVISIPLVGAPEDRKERILRSILRDSNHFLRFLLFLLADESDIESSGPRGTSAEGDGGAVSSFLEPASLFESMVKALHRNRSQLDEIARLVEDLRKAEDGPALLPEGFDEIWDPIWEARKRSSSR
jgi:hypothetical protein